ncbi:hypothetical protein H5202_14740 [Shewanella sp. SG41-4]|uniref:hypothetical protein n=1 Tax=Shewanella sp. SG41-4 TaxID=2760976 RepID=UPI0015FFD464|nr:hypothetical protein [Shewanella sp. SG41-4]MBB1439906.1 hypothetical protein [Shewanella sp. SG41-4]
MIKVTSKLKHFFIAVTALLLAACANTPQPPVALNTNLLANPDLKLGMVYRPPTSKATTHIYGAGCLLCYGVASALTAKLDDHLQKAIDDSELSKMNDLVKAKYSQYSKNIEYVTLPTSINRLKKFKGELGFAEKDFRPLKETLGIDVLVVFEIYRHGAYRSFSNYFPNGDPQGHVAGILYAIDLNTNAYIHYKEINEMIQPAGEWDEPKDFPSVTTAYYQAVENVKKQLEQSI